MASSIKEQFKNVFADKTSGRRSDKGGQQRTTYASDYTAPAASTTSSSSSGSMGGKTGHLHDVGTTAYKQPASYDQSTATGRIAGAHNDSVSTYKTATNRDLDSASKVTTAGDMAKSGNVKTSYAANGTSTGDATTYSSNRSSSIDTAHMDSATGTINGGVSGVVNGGVSGGGGGISSHAISSDYGMNGTVIGSVPVGAKRVGTTSHTTATSEMIDREFFTKTEDHEILIEKKEYMLEHRPVQKEYVVETRYIGEKPVAGKGAEFVAREMREVEERVVPMPHGEAAIVLMAVDRGTDEGGVVKEEEVVTQRMERVILQEGVLPATFTNAKLQPAIVSTAPAATIAADTNAAAVHTKIV